MTLFLTKFSRDGVAAFAWVVLALLLVTLTGWIYIPGSAGPALFDDYSNVAVIPDLSDSPELAMDYVLGNRSGPLGRPVSMASFVLESLLFVDRNIETSKLINIGLHLLNTCLVIWLFYLLFRYIEVPSALGLGVLLGLAWALSPVYVSTVLYVVQRMAMLAATFMLLAMITYCYWRNGIRSGYLRLDLLLSSCVCFLLAIYSKENAIILLPLILMLEALWFEFKGPRLQVLKKARLVVFLFIGLGASLVFLVLIFGREWYAGGFEHRHFTLCQRLLTEARILWDYVLQLILPEVQRMGIYHDDLVVSRSLFDPLTTFWSVLAWAVLFFICGVLLRWQYGRYLVFAMAFFLIGHSVESTIFPLELYFEHRNYFPGIGLFLGVGLLYWGLVRLWPEVKSPLLVYLGIYILFLASQTSSQAEIWSNPTLLVLNNLSAHPQSFRANADMARLMAQQGDIQAAREYSARAFAVSVSERSGDYAVRDLALMCAVNEVVDDELLTRAGVENSVRPLSSVNTLLALVRMLQDNSCPKFDRIAFADQMAKIFLEDAYPNKGASNIYASLAVLENALERYDNAYAYTERFLLLSPENTRGLLMKLHFATALGEKDQAGIVARQLLKMRDEGRLTVSEQQTLALYVEN